MTDKKSPPGKEQSPPADTSGGKKPHATIDLKATEVKDPAAGASASGGDKAKAAGKGDAPKAAASTSVPGTGDKPAGVRPEAGKAEAAAKSTWEKKPDDAKAGGKPKGPEAATSTSSASAKSAPPPPREQRSRSGIGSVFSHLVAGLVGGFVMLLGADSLQPQIAQLKSTLGLPGQAGKTDAAVEKLTSRIAALETAQGEAKPAVQEALEQKFANAEARIGELESLQDAVAKLTQTQDELSQRAAALAEQAAEVREGSAIPEERIAKLEQQLSTMTAFAESNENSGIVPRLAALTGRMSDLEETLKNQIAAVRAGVSEDVEQRIAKVAEASEAARSGTQRMDRQLAGVTNDAARLGQQLETVKADTTRLGDTLRVVQEETGKITSRLDGLEGELNSKISKLASPADVETAVLPVAEQVSSLQSRVENVVSAEKDRAQNAKRIVLALELGNLERAIERGDGFAEELTKVKQTAGDLIDVSKLEQYGASGVIPVVQLQSMFRPVAHDIIEASAAPAGDSVFDQLLANARSVVKVRKVTHDVDDNSAEAIVSRIEGALEAGRLSEVLSLAQDLPEGGRNAASGWLKKVEDRHAVDLALASIEEQLKDSLSGTN